MLSVQLCIYLCMYLRQAVSLPPSLGIEWDLFRRIPLAEDVQLEPALTSCSVAVVLFPAAPLQPRQVRRGKTGPVLRRIARDRRLLSVLLRSRRALRRLSVPSSSDASRAIFFTQVCNPLYSVQYLLIYRIFFILAADICTPPSRLSWMTRPAMMVSPSDDCLPSHD